jgi:hypothetical protein
MNYGGAVFGQACSKCLPAIQRQLVMVCEANGGRMLPDGQVEFPRSGLPRIDTCEQLHFLAHHVLPFTVSGDFGKVGDFLAKVGVQFTERDSGVFVIPKEDVRRFERACASSHGLVGNLARVLFRAFSDISVNVFIDSSHEVYTVRYVSNENALMSAAA